MREILFRGQTRRYGEKVYVPSGEKVPSNWVYGGVYQGCGDHSIIYSYDPVEKYPVYSDTVGQYTGLTDKNGVKIFEGDIIKAIWRHLGNIDTVIGLVKFIDASFVLETKNEYLFFEDNIFGIECEIIGNIYDRRCENG